MNPTSSWTDDELDGALRALGDHLDQAVAAAPRAVPARDAVATVDGVDDVVSLGSIPSRPRRRLPARRVLAVAALVVAFLGGGAVGVALWPGTSDQPAPTGANPGGANPGGSSPAGPTAVDPAVEAEASLLPDPAAGAARVLARQVGQGDGTVSADLGTDPAGVSIVYRISCGDPTADPAAAGVDPPQLVVYTYSEGVRVDLLSRQCGPLSTAGASGTVASTAAVTRLGLQTVSVTTSRPDVVWRVAVVSAG